MEPKDYIPYDELTSKEQNVINTQLDPTGFVYEAKKRLCKERKGLDKLINDLDEDVRVAVAEQDFGLDKLIGDESEYVRSAVARQGYGIDKLINDKSSFVSHTAKNYLNTNYDKQPMSPYEQSLYIYDDDYGKFGLLDAWKKDFPERVIGEAFPPKENFTLRAKVNKSDVEDINEFENNFDF